MLPILSPPRSPLFPYTTLFRSQAEPRLTSHCGFDPVTGSMPESTMGTMTANAILSDLIQRPAQAAEALPALSRSEEHTSELQSRGHLVCRLLLEKKKTQ